MNEAKRSAVFRLGQRVLENAVDDDDVWDALERCFGGPLTWVTRMGEAAGMPTPTTTTVTIRPTSTTVRVTTTTKPPGATTTTTLPLSGGVTPTDPVQGRDRSVRISRQDTCGWWRGKTATQPQAIELHNQWTRIFPEGLAFSETIPACPATKGKTDLTAMMTRLAGDYVVSKGCPNFKVIPACRDYSTASYLLSDLRACALREPEACAASPYLTEYLAEAMDVRVETVTNGNGTTARRCVAGNLAPVALPQQPYDSAVAVRGLLDFNIARAPLTPAQKAISHEMHLTHEAVTAGQCGWGPMPPPGVVKQLRLKLVATARNEDEKHLLQDPDFSSAIDTDCEHGQCWKPDEVCAWGQIKDYAHKCGMANVNATGGPAPPAGPGGEKMSGFTDGSCRNSRMIDAWACWVIHQLAHTCAAYRNDEILVRFPCDQLEIANCPRLSCADWLKWFTVGPSAFPKITRKHARIPWLPVDWRRPATPTAAPQM